MSVELAVRVHRQPGTFSDAEIGNILRSIPQVSGARLVFEVVETHGPFSGESCLELLALPQWSAQALNLFLLPAQVQRYAAYPHVYTLVSWNPSEPFLSQYLAQVVPARQNLDLARQILEGGEEHFKQKQFGLAQECFAATLRAWPDSVPAILGSGRVALQGRDYPDAESWFRRALQLEPSARIYSQLGRSLAGQKRWQEAIECARQAEMDTWWDHKALGEYLLEAGHRVEAEACLRDAARAHPDKVYCWLELARAYRLMGRPEDEQKTLQFAVQCEPQSKFAWSHLARVCSKLNDSEGCLEAARKAIALGDDSTSMHKLLLTYEAQITLTSEGVTVAFATHTPQSAAGLENLAKEQPDQADLLLRAAEKLKEIVLRDPHGIPAGYQPVVQLARSSPGLEALEAALFPLYGRREPLFYGSSFGSRRGGLDGISVFAS